MIKIPNKNYQRGFSAEKRCQSDLEKEGFWTQRAYGSKGSWDVIAVNGKTVKLIEVKRSKRHIVKFESIIHQYNDVIQKFMLIPDGSCSKELWIWFDKQGKVGDKNYKPAHWQRIYCRRNEVAIE